MKHEESREIFLSFGLEYFLQHAEKHVGVSKKLKKKLQRIQRRYQLTTMRLLLQVLLDDSYLVARSRYSLTHKEFKEFQELLKEFGFGLEVQLTELDEE